MSIRIAINGFGRIGRSVFRILNDHKKIEVVCINDVFKIDALAYLLKYDTVMGTFKEEVTFDDHALYVGGKKILMTSVRNPAEAKWKDLGIDIVVESTGIFTSRADLEKHLAAGAKRVLLTVPPKDNVDHMVVMGVNDDQLKPEHRLVSNASWLLWPRCSIRTLGSNTA
jgi:glyceraldehyde 3-phosphate dehydrogenase